MDAPLKPGYYLPNTDDGMLSGGHHVSGEAPGLAAIGVFLRTPRLARLDQVSETIGSATHNVAEYRALIEGLRLARRHRIERIRIYMDSELVVDQMNDVLAVKQPDLTRLHETARDLTGQFASHRICWVPREMNVEADALVRAAFERADAGPMGHSSEPPAAQV